MKTENTPENKERFIALYWGQTVLLDVNNGGELVLYPVERSNMYRIEESILELAPLSQITDKDATEVASLMGIQDLSGEDVVPFVRKCIQKYEKQGKGMDFVFADLFRSKGYAVPFMGLSVEKLVEYGWIKLKEVKK